MTGIKESIILIVIMAITTFATRVIPFIIFPPGRKTPDIIVYLGKVLPYAIIGMLIIYCLKSISITQAPGGLPELISILFVVFIHKWKHNLLLSIGGGTILYMILIQVVFT